MYKPVTFTLDKGTEALIKGLNLTLEEKSGLKIGESFIVRTALDEFLRNQKSEQIVMDRKASEA